MQLDRFGVVSAIKDSAYQENRQIDKLEFNEVNFNKLVYEVLSLRKENVIHLREINTQKKEIISLYNRLNSESEYSPLKVSAG